MKLVKYGWSISISLSLSHVNHSLIMIDPSFVMKNRLPILYSHLVMLNSLAPQIAECWLFKDVQDQLWQEHMNAPHRRIFLSVQVEYIALYTCTHLGCLITHCMWHYYRRSSHWKSRSNIFCNLSIMVLNCEFHNQTITM